MTYENITAPLASRRARPGCRRRPSPWRGSGHFSPWSRSSLNWATLTLQGETPVTASGLDSEMNGRFTVVLGLVALVIVAVLALRPVKGLWVLLPILGLLITFIGWAQTRKLQNTLDAIGVGTSDAVKATNGIGVWLTIAGGVLLLATAVLVPATRRRG